MTIVLPIFLFAIVVGLAARRITPIHWIAMVAWIVAVVAYNYMRAS